MSDNYLEKEIIVASDFTQKSLVDMSKKCWQTPKLIEMDYSETKLGPPNTNSDSDGYQS